MDTLIKAIRTRLTSDATLTAMVSAEDITSSYNAEYADYPCVVLGIEEGGSSFEISGVTRATFAIDVYSKTNKQRLWAIYDQIKALLHNQERSITDASCVIHLIYETTADDSDYDLARDVWHLTAQRLLLQSRRA